ncbi:hypothetical protein CONCODRAFT_78596, partial [Conidiobolus coronatus NRRL 28638]
MTSIVPLKLNISLNIIFISLYALFKDNIILTASEKEKGIVFAIITQFALVYEFLKLVVTSEDLTNVCVASIYLTTILVSLVLYCRWPELFDRFRKFNFGFSTLYVVLALSNSQIVKLSLCIILGILADYSNYGNSYYFVIIASNTIYSFFMMQGLILLNFTLVPSGEEVSVLIGLIAVGTVTVVLSLIAVILQLRIAIRSNVDGYSAIEIDDIEEGTPPNLI